MMYPFMTLNDETEIVHSEMIDGIVKVYIETPDEKLCFKHATCYLPEKNGKMFMVILMKNLNI